MSLSPIVETKRALRRTLRAARASWRMAALDAGHAVAGHLLPALSATPYRPGPVSAYWPMGDEFDVRPALQALFSAGWHCALPVVVAREAPLVFRAWQPGDRLVDAGFGTSVPPADAPVLVPRVLLVPLLAFDARGFRLGYGGGYYDRTLASLRRAGDVLAIGIGYAAQEIDHVPREPFDQRLDLIATERGLLHPAVA
ncbi:MAG: 5-formyltetrahydrofolate cyclo-ligase [Alphaproteobacteria bacterium]|nr:5-formyltetrahydrofolate cyclo-ligase [Alphaproteobacteria bacterium]